MILGLDLGRNIGWVKGNTVGPMERGTFPLSDSTDLGRWLAESDPFFRTVLPGVTGIAVEQPFMGKDFKSVRKLVALLGHLHWWAAMPQFQVSGYIREIAISTGKLTLSGSGAADGDRMIAAAAERGCPVDDDHQAHALGIWWVYAFGAAEPIRKAKSRSSAPVVVKP